MHSRSLVIGRNLAVVGALMLLGLCTSACSHSESDGGLSKSRAAELMDDGEEVDYCERNGWYGDGECDTFCAEEDPDCASDDGSGSGGDESGDTKAEDSDESYEPCGGKACGEQCTKCPPGDEDCVETDVVKYCQPDGSCAGGEPSCRDDGGDDYEPCGDKTCGEQCTKCPPGDEDCVETQVVKYCQADGDCEASAPSCR